MQSSGYFPMITDRERALPFYIATIGKSIPQSRIYRPCGIRDYQILFSVKGRGKVTLEHQEVILEKGSLLFLTPNTPHDYYGLTDDWITHWVTFSGTAAEKLMPAENGIYKIPDWDDFNTLFEQMHGLPRDAQWLERSTVLLYALLIKCSLSIFPSDVASVNKVKQQLLPAITYLEEHYNQPILLSALSGLLKVTDEQICRMFRTAYHIRPMEYVNLLRIQKAKELLIHKKAMTVCEISRAVGYESPSYFCCLFKRTEKMTAGEYKNLF